MHFFKSDVKGITDFIISLLKKWCFSLNHTYIISVIK